MAEIDRQKERVAFWRNLFFFVLAAIFGMVGYLFTHYKILETIDIVLVNIGIMSLVVFLIFVMVKLTKETDKLKDL